jgi:hypothetical protein
VLEPNSPSIIWADLSLLWSERRTGYITLVTTVVRLCFILSGNAYAPKALAAGAGLLLCA